MSIPNTEKEIGRHQAPDSALRELLSTLIGRCSKSREQIAQEMSLHAAQPISERMLNDWTAESKKPARFPAIFIKAFCDVTGSDELQRFFMSPRDLKLVEFAERELTAAKDQRDRQRIAARLFRSKNSAREDS